MNERLNQIFQQYHVSKTKELRTLISDLDPEIDSLMKIDSSDYEEFFKATQLIADYGIQLNNQGYLRKAKNYIEKGISNLKIDEKLKGTDLLKNELYEYLIWTRGLINHTLKNYLSASKDFKSLALKFPENDRYRNWYNSCIVYWPNQIMWGLTFFIFILLISKYVIGLKIESYYYLDFICLVGLIGTWIYKIKMRL